MGLMERLKEIIEQEFEITTDEQLSEAVNELDMSVYGIFTTSKRKGDENA